MILLPAIALFLLTQPGEGKGPELPAPAASAESPSKEAEQADEQQVANEEEEEDTPPGNSEMEALRALEEVAVDPEAQTLLQMRALLDRLGPSSPLRHHLETYFLERDWPLALPDAANATSLFDLSSFDVGQVKGKYDIPVEMHPLVGQYIRFFQGRGRQWFVRWMSRSTRYIPLFQPILTQYGMPKDTVYLSMIESGFSSQAYSWAHASGPWQFIASTGKHFQLKQDFWIDERRDPIKSTHAASRFLSQLYRELGHWHLAWAAYNTGGGRVRRVINKKGSTNFWVISQGRGLAKETKHYVPKLIAAALVAKHYREFGFKDEEFEYQEPFAFEEVPVDGAIELDILAKAAGTTVEELRELNPELKRWCTPPATREAPYVLRVPPGHAKMFQENYAKLDPSVRLLFEVHRVARGDTLNRIAGRYKTLPEIVMRMNAISQPRPLRVGTELVIPVLGETEASSRLAEQAEQARLAGFVAPRPEDEIPAGTFRKTASGSVKREIINGQTRITYGVANGDSLWLIGQRFKCSVADLMRWNDLTSRSKLRVGMALIIWAQEKQTAQK